MLILSLLGVDLALNAFAILALLRSDLRLIQRGSVQGLLVARLLAFKLVEPLLLLGAELIQRHRVFWSACRELDEGALPAHCWLLCSTLARDDRAINQRRLRDLLLLLPVLFLLLLWLRLLWLILFGQVFKEGPFFWLCLGCRWWLLSRVLLFHN